MRQQQGFYGGAPPRQQQRSILSVPFAGDMDGGGNTNITCTDAFRSLLMNPFGGMKKMTAAANKSTAMTTATATAATAASAAPAQSMDDAEETIANAMKQLSLEEHVQIGNEMLGVAGTTSSSATPHVASGSIQHDVSLDNDEGNDTYNHHSADSKFVKERIRQMDVVLDWLVTHTGTDTKDYERATFLSPTKYVTNEAFKLRFLRSTDIPYDSKQAAYKLVDYFRAKAFLFGQDLLVKDEISYDDDLTKDDHAAIESGILQINPNVRDSYGRVVAFATVLNGASFYTMPN